MPDAQFALIALAGFAAGAVNALAGGGTLISFPALVAAGFPPLAANPWARMERRLVDNLPRMVVANRRQAGRAIGLEVERRIAQQVEGRFSTHPTSRQRIARALREKGVGVFASDLPATVLFADVEALERRVSLALYQQQLGNQVKSQYLVPHEEIRERQLGQRALDLLRLGGVAPGALGTREEIVDVREDLVEIERLAEERPGPVPHRLVRLLGARGHHHGDGVGAGIGPEDVHEGPGVEHRAAVVEQHEIWMAEHRELEGPCPVPGMMDLVPLLPQRAGERPDRREVGICEQDLPDGGHVRNSDQ